MNDFHVGGFAGHLIEIGEGFTYRNPALDMKAKAASKSRWRVLIAFGCYSGQVAQQVL